MSIELYWDNDERTVLLLEIDGAWTWDEMDAMLAKIKKVTDAATFEMGAIIDVSAGVTFPGGSMFTPTAFEHAKQMLRMGEGGTGPVVIVGANSLIRTVYNAMVQLDPQKMGSVQFAQTQDQARSMLSERMQAPV